MSAGVPASCHPPVDYGMDRKRLEPDRLPVSGALTAARGASGIVAGALFVTTVIGWRFGEEQGLYQPEPLLLQQFHGQDAVALLFVLPLMLFAMWRAALGSARGLMVWAGTLIWVAYWYHFYLGGIPFGPLFLLHATLVGSALFADAALLLRVDVERLAHRFGPTFPAGPLGGLMVGMGSLFGLAWAADVLSRLRHGETIDTVSRAVYAADLTVMLPATIAAGVLLWRRHTWGFVMSGPLIVNAFLSMVTLTVTSVMVLLAGVEVPAAQVAVFALASLVMGACVLVFVRATRV